MPSSRRWLRRLLIVLGVLAGVVVVALGAIWYWLKLQMLPSGGPLSTNQAAYDVRRYDLEIAIDPETKRISGKGTTTVVATAPLARFDLQLDDRLKVTRVAVDGAAASFTHDDGLIAVPLSTGWQAGERHAVEVVYAGKPKVAARPPWIDGFVWRETPSGAPWLGVTVQSDGADDWWPAKDHPSDEPDEGLSMALTLPSTLVGLSNGRKTGQRENADGTTTTFWEVSYPINNYLVTFNAAPYVPVEATYRGIDGTLEVPIVFWAIPEHVEPAKEMWAWAPKMLETMARRYGEYPFLADKFWVAEAPYLGMEHQTLVAYGAKFEMNRFDFDWLLLHETAHEWWGNKISVADWADFWIQEGFANYAEALYVLDTSGDERYLDYMRGVMRRIRNKEPIVAGKDLTAAEAYKGDIYPKGAATLHSLKWLIGDDAFFDLLHRFANDERFAYRLVSTADFERLVGEVTGTEVPWFFDVYLRRAAPPRWTMTRNATADGKERIDLAWDDPAFQLPLPVAVGGEAMRVPMPHGRGEIEVAGGAEVAVDPDGRIYAKPAGE